MSVVLTPFENISLVEFLCINRSLSLFFLSQFESASSAFDSIPKPYLSLSLCYCFVSSIRFSFTTMRKGTKRKTKHTEPNHAAPPPPEAAAPLPPSEEINDQPPKPPRAKRVRRVKPESEPEYFEDKRNLVSYCYDSLIGFLFVFLHFVLIQFWDCAGRFVEADIPCWN